MKILTIAFKDLTRSFRSVFAVGMMVVAPLLLIGLINFAFGGASKGSTDMPAVRVGIVNADRLPAGTPLEQALGDSMRGMFYDESVASWITAADYNDQASARSAIDNQEIGVAVIIPQDFTSSFLSGEAGSKVLILSDPTLTLAPQVVQNMVVSMLDGVVGASIAYQTVVERQQANGLQPEADQPQALIDSFAGWYSGFQRVMFHDSEHATLVMVSSPEAGASENPIQKVLRTMMAGQLVFFAFFTGANSMISILHEDEEGTLARLFTTPVNRTSILAGKFLAVFLTVVVQGLVMIAATHYVFDMEWGNLFAAALVLVGQVVAAVGLGVLLISFVKTSRQGGSVIGGGLTVMGLLGGLFTSGFAMPKAFSMLSNITPQGWVIKGWNVVLNGQPLSDLLLPFAVMTAMGVLMFGIGARMFQKRYA